MMGEMLMVNENILSSIVIYFKVAMGASQLNITIWIYLLKYFKIYLYLHTLETSDGTVHEI